MRQYSLKQIAKEKSKAMVKFLFTRIPHLLPSGDLALRVVPTLQLRFCAKQDLVLCPTMTAGTNALQI